MKKIFIVMLLTLNLTCISYGWYNASWTYRNKITFDTNQASSTVTNFPVLIRLTTATANIDDFFSDAQSDFDDVVFVDNDDVTKLSHEIVDYSYSTSSGSFVSYIKYPSLSTGTANPFVYMYYGNSGASNQEDSENVWDGDYIGVWHCNNYTVDTEDSTSRNNDGDVDYTGKITNSTGQGVACDSTNVYTTESNNLTKRTMDNGVAQLVNISTTVVAYGTFGDCGTDDDGDHVYTCRLTGVIQKWNKSDLTIVSNYHTSISTIMTGVDIYDGVGWIMTGEANDMKVFKCDLTDWTTTQMYTLNRTFGGSNGGYQGITWGTTNQIYCQAHNGATPFYCDVYELQNDSFVHIDTITALGRGQGIGYDHDETEFWVSDAYSPASNQNWVRRCKVVNSSFTGVAWLDTGKNTQYTYEYGGGNCPGDYIRVPDSADFVLGDKEWTISFWVNPAHDGTWECYLSQRQDHTTQNAFGIWYHSTPNVRFIYGNNSSVTLGSPPSNGSWAKIDVVRSANTLIMYTNGAAGTPQAMSDTLSDSSKDLIIGGGNSDAVGYNLNADMYEVRISTVQRSSAWILTEYNIENDPEGFITLEGEETDVSGIKKRRTRIMNFIF